MLDLTDQVKMERTVHTDALPANTHVAQAGGRKTGEEVREMVWPRD